MEPLSEYSISELNKKVLSKKEMTSSSNELEIENNGIPGAKTGGGGMLRKRTKAVVDYKESVAEDDLDGDDDYEADMKKRASSKKKARSAETDFDAQLNEDDEDFGDSTETGRVTNIYVQDFMSHRKFELNFGRNVNFVTGPNGSGKSAIVAALQLCLGTRMNHTGRGSSMATLIRQGSSGPAIVRVTLLNEGPDAYKQDMYGKRITVERIIPKTGPATFKIRGVDGVVRSKERRELDNILKTMSIYCDNPCCVLTQELSKRFIQGNETDKYDFFLKATGLELTLGELMKIKGDIVDTAKLIEDGTTKLNTKKDRVKSLHDEVEKYKQFDQLEEKIIECLVKQFWVDFYIENDMIVEIENNLKLRRKNFIEAANAVTDAEKDRDESEDLEAIEIQIKDAHEKQGALAVDLDFKNKKLLEHTRCIPAISGRLKEMQNEFSTNNKRLMQVQDTIKNMRTVALSVAKDNERIIMKDIDAKLQEMETLEQKNRNAYIALEEKTRIRDHMDENRRECNPRIRNLETSARNIRDEITHFSAKGQDRSSLFHKAIPNILDKIKKSKQFRHEVIGPIGLHVKLKEGCKQFTIAIEKVIRGVLKSFVVSCKEDQNTLAAILRECGAASSIVIACNPKNARYSGSKLKHITNGLSVADALVIDNDTAFNFLIDRTNMDAVLLSTDEDDVEKNFLVDINGETTFRDKITQAVLTDGTIIRYRNGNKGRDVNRDDPRQTSVLVEDMAVVVSALRERLLREEANLKDARNEQLHIEEDLQRINKEIKAHETEIKHNSDCLRRETRVKNGLQNDLEQLQEAGKIDTTSLEEEERELRVAIDSFTRSITAAETDLAAAEAEKKQLATSKLHAQRACDEVKASIDLLSDKLEHFMNKKVEIQHVIERCKSKAANAERVVKDTQEILERQRSKVEEKKCHAEEKTSNLLKDKWDGNVVDIGPKDTFDSLERRREMHQKKLDEGKKQVGLSRVTRDQSIANLNIAQNDYQQLKSELEDLKNMAANLSADYKARRNAWKNQRDRCAAIVESRFDVYLNDKGANGTVQFDHKEKRLMLECQTDNFDEKTQCTDVKQLSGGERSFTTLCLLLALGHVIDTPFRILDEYDVFMDENVRRVTLDQIREHALRPEQLEKQFIIVTPNNVNDIVTNKRCVIHKLKAPEREASVGLHQTTLNVSRL